MLVPSIVVVHHRPGWSPTWRHQHHVHAAHPRLRPQRLAALPRRHQARHLRGQILAYDLNLDRPGYLIPNSVEQLLVNLSFDTYLDLGSIKETAEAVNRRGYRTKSDQSRRGKPHAGTEFTISSMQYLLKNVAYIGKKDIIRSNEAGESVSWWTPSGLPWWAKRSSTRSSS